MTGLGMSLGVGQPHCNGDSAVLLVDANGDILTDSEGNQIREG